MKRPRPRTSRWWEVDDFGPLPNGERPSGPPHRSLPTTASFPRVTVIDNVAVMMIPVEMYERLVADSEAYRVERIMPGIVETDAEPALSEESTIPAATSADPVAASKPVVPDDWPPEPRGRGQRRK